MSGSLARYLATYRIVTWNFGPEAVPKLEEGFVFSLYIQFNKLDWVNMQFLSRME